MRWIRYTDDRGTHYGILEGDVIQKVEGSPFERAEPSGERARLADVRLEVPVIPRTFYCAGLNYAAHVIEAARKKGIEPNLPPAADIGYRANNALLPHEGEVVMPADAKTVHYEGELVVVIGKQARRLSPAQALDCVFGYTIGNDVSERLWQRADRTLWRAKNTDTFKPMGPWIETDFDLAQAVTRVRVNGEETTVFRTGDMLYDIPTFISRMSQYLTLWPGDVIWMGTDGWSPDLKHGDVVEVDISGLGVLRNRFVSEGKS